ncbi:MAG TPA: hypothetical protein VI248_03520 [Kineosporiaceae bacterium]
MTWTVILGLDGHPFVLPAALTWWCLCGPSWLVVRERRRRRGLPGPSGWSLLFWAALGGLCAVTLTPSWIGLGVSRDTRGSWCLLTPPRTGFGLWAPNPERRWNVIIGIPLGVAALGWACSRRPAAGPVRRPAAGPVRRWTTTIPVRALAAPAAALAAPVGIELAQGLLPALGRTCAVVDVVDNDSGVVLGLLLVAVGMPVAAAVRGAVRSLVRVRGSAAGRSTIGGSGRPSTPDPRVRPDREVR